MPKMTYKVTVGSSSTVIAPDLNKQGVADFVAGAVVAGDYSYNPANEMRYWAVTAGTSVSAPTHTLGAETVDGIEWLALNQARNLVISADPSNPIFLAKDSIATGNEGIYFDGSKARDYDNYMGKVTGIAETSDAIITVEV